MLRERGIVLLKETPFPDFLEQFSCQYAPFFSE